MVGFLLVLCVCAGAYTRVFEHTNTGHNTRQGKGTQRPRERQRQRERDIHVHSRERRRSKSKHFMASTLRQIANNPEIV